MDQDISHSVTAPRPDAGERPRYSLALKLIVHPVGRLHAEGAAQPMSESASESAVPGMGTVTEDSIALGTSASSVEGGASVRLADPAWGAPNRFGSALNPRESVANDDGGAWAAG